MADSHMCLGSKKREMLIKWWETFVLGLLEVEGVGVR